MRKEYYSPIITIEKMDLKTNCMAVISAEIGGTTDEFDAKGLSTYWDLLEEDDTKE